MLNLSPETREFLLFQQENYPFHPFFQKSEAHPAGKPLALQKCQTALMKLANGKFQNLPQASLEFLLRVCQDKDSITYSPRTGVLTHDLETAKKIRKELKEIAKLIRAILQANCYEKASLQEKQRAIDRDQSWP